MGPHRGRGRPGAGRQGAVSHRVTGGRPERPRSPAARRPRWTTGRPATKTSCSASSAAGRGREPCPGNLPAGPPEGRPLRLPQAVQHVVLHHRAEPGDRLPEEEAGRRPGRFPVAVGIGTGPRAAGGRADGGLQRGTRATGPRRRRPAAPVPGGGGPACPPGTLVSRAGWIMGWSTSANTTDEETRGKSRRPPTKGAPEKSGGQAVCHFDRGPKGPEWSAVSRGPAGNLAVNRTARFPFDSASPRSGQALGSLRSLGMTTRAAATFFRLTPDESPG